MSTYFFYRYQVTPNRSRFNHELDFDGKGVGSIEELEERKGEYFKGVLDRYLDYSTDAVISKGEVEGNLYDMYFAKRKLLEFEKDFKIQRIETEPSLNVVVCTDTKIQMIAMRWGTKAFRTKEAAIRWIASRISRFLSAAALDLSITPVYKSEDFWKYARLNTDNISGIQFTITYPNLPSARKEIGETLKALTRSTNSGKTVLQLSSAGKGPLEIAEDDEYLKDLVDYSAEGGSEIKIKETKSRSFSSLDTKPITRIIEDESLFPVDAEVFRSVLKESTMGLGGSDE